MSNIMAQYWTNFAKYGHPTPFWTKGSELWTRVEPNLRNYLEIKPYPQMKKNLQKKRMQFWDRLIWSYKDCETATKQHYNCFRI